MIAYESSANVKTTNSGDCGCGCGCGCAGKCGCAVRCCDLECLVRPNFFCGQMLTDADLGAMVEWTRSRLALVRYRDGWGVVCGLDVTCAFPGSTPNCCGDATAGPTVYVNPGYAIDCCGNDLVVCKPVAVSLGDVCLPQDDPCASPPKPKEDPQPKKDPTGKPGEDDCLAMFRDRMVAVDLKLRFHEDLARGQRPMFRSGCAEVEPCEYTRVLEQPCVYAEIAPTDSKRHDQQDWRAKEEEFQKRREKAIKEISDVVAKGAESVLRHLRTHPPYKFCFIEDFVCCLVGQDDKKSWERWHNDIRYWIILDWFLHELECPCWSCRPDDGVPIARVLLRRVAVRGKLQCKVMLIETGNGFRRALRKDECRPFPHGAIDLVPYLWQPREYAATVLAQQGIEMVHTPGDATTLHERLDYQAISLEQLRRGPLHAHVLEDLFGVERIAAFELPAKA